LWRRPRPRLGCGAKEIIIIIIIDKSTNYEILYYENFGYLL
jgi:hypothetical protein